MSLTTIVSNVFKPRQKSLEKYVHDAEDLQHEVLMRLLASGKNTEYGVKHLLNTTNSYEKFAQNVPVNTYEELKGDIDRMRHGEKDILWPGQVKWFAKSSGTTNDKSKFIPVHQRQEVCRISITRVDLMPWHIICVITLRARFSMARA